MSRAVYGGSTSQSTVIRFLDSTTGIPVTTVVAATAGLVLQYVRDQEAPVAIAPHDLANANAAWSAGGIFHVGDGYYRLDSPDAAFAVGADDVIFIGSATGIVCVGSEHDIVGTLLPPDGDTYCLRSDIEQIFGKDNVKKWADLDNNVNLADIDARIDYMIVSASEDFRDRIRTGPYALPLVMIPRSVTRIVATSAGVMLYESRSFGDEQEMKVEAQRKRYEKWVADFLMGRIRLDMDRVGASFPQVVTDEDEETTPDLVA